MNDPGALVDVVRALDALLRTSTDADAAMVARLSSEAAALGVTLDTLRARLVESAAATLAPAQLDAAPGARLALAVSSALAATDLDAAIRALREPAAPPAREVARAALRVRLGLAFRLCAAALAGVAGHEFHEQGATR